MEAGRDDVATMMKGLPLAYNKDMQEDKEAIFDSVDTIKLCLSTLTPMIDTMTVIKDNMANAGKRGFINATDCADYLVKKGLAFRDAYKITGSLVAICIDKGLTLDNLPIEEYKKLCDKFDDGIYEAISLQKCVEERKATGGPSPEAVAKHIEKIKNTVLKEDEED